MNKETYFTRQKSEQILINSSTYFYVYLHLKSDTKEPFYVGKGCGGRAWNFNNRNQFWINTKNKHGIVVQILKFDMNELEALTCEVQTIKDLSSSFKLCNLSSGGETPVFSKEVRKRMSDSHKGKKPTVESIEKTANFHRGRKRSQETCKRISESLKGKVMLNRQACKEGGLNRSGSKSSVADKNTYSFINTSGEIFIGYRYEFCKKYPLLSKTIGKLFGSNPRNSTHNWSLIKETNGTNCSTQSQEEVITA